MNKKRDISLSQFQNTFPDVPEMYFQSLEDIILHKTVYKAELREKLLLYLRAKPDGFELLTVPDSYFETLASAINATLSEDMSTGKAWSRLKKEEIYETPDTYFDGLSNRIRTRVAMPNQAKPSLEWLPSLLKQPAYIMAAAVCVCVMWFGYNKLTENSDRPSQGWTTAMETLSRHEIVTYITANTSTDLDIQHLTKNDWEAELSKTKLNDADANNLIFTDEL